jgi:hypothetical protein
MTVGVTFASVGASEAKIVAIWADLGVRVSGGWLTARPNTAPLPVTPIRFPSGSRHLHTVRAEGEEGENITMLWGQISGNPVAVQPSDALCVVGEIQYVDTNGIRYHTGFLRLYDPASNSWRPERESDHEYQD